VLPLPSNSTRQRCIYVAAVHARFRGAPMALLVVPLRSFRVLLPSDDITVTMSRQHSESLPIEVQGQHVVNRGNSEAAAVVSQNASVRGMLPPCRDCRMQEPTARATTPQAALHGNNAPATWPGDIRPKQTGSNRTRPFQLCLEHGVSASPTVANWVEKRGPFFILLPFLHGTHC
jgi:hypothetical protein